MITLQCETSETSSTIHQLHCWFTNKFLLYSTMYTTFCFRIPWLTLIFIVICYMCWMALVVPTQQDIANLHFLLIRRSFPFHSPSSLSSISLLFRVAKW